MMQKHSIPRSMASSGVKISLHSSMESFTVIFMMNLELRRVITGLYYAYKKVDNILRLHVLCLHKTEKWNANENQTENQTFHD